MIVSAAPASPEAVASHYDELDAFYRDVWGDHVHHGVWRTDTETRAEAVRELVDLIAEAAAIQPGARVCDIGCGYGAPARVLAKAYRAEVTAITVSAAQNAFARGLPLETDGPTPEYRLGDWLKNDLPDASFDAAIAIESSEHMPLLAGFFEQARRILRPGGRLAVSAWLSCDAPTAAQERWLLEPICREGRMPHMGTANDYVQTSAAAGFSLVDYTDRSREVERTWPEIVRIFAGKLARNPAYFRFLLSRRARNRVFAITIFRIWLAYRTGAMRYGIFSFRADASDEKPLLPVGAMSSDDAPFP